MTGIRLQSVEMLNILWLMPVLIGLLIYAGQKRKKALNAFVGSGLAQKLAGSVSATARRWKAALLLAGMGFVVLALARPGWNPKARTVQRKGRDVVFILDVSKSMLAEDLAPNRLERAKLAIVDCLEKLRGDRVGLIAFSGTAVVKCPLTLDYGFFRMMLDNISPDSVSRGGTMIGDAIRKAMDELLDDKQKKYKDIILITDGEDHDSFPVQAAEQAGKKGIRILAIGLGNENEGTRIPVVDEHGTKRFLMYDGKEVWSRLDADTLRKMVAATSGGKYLNVATGAIDLGTVYEQLVNSAEKKALESMTIKRYEEKFQIFISVALLLLVAEMFISERKREVNGQNA